MLIKCAFLTSDLQTYENYEEDTKTGSCLACIDIFLTLVHYNNRSLMRYVRMQSTTVVKNKIICNEFQYFVYFQYFQ